jgi:catechol 2,3-dioxygenase-like lactoylglutathione lyase family enzyme
MVGGTCGWPRGRMPSIGAITMKVKRIVANIEAADVAAADAFYRGVLGLDLVMDHGWLRTYASSPSMAVQVSIASQGGSDTPVPDLSVEVDDLAEALRRVRDAGTPVTYGPVSEPWGVRRFYVRDPLGRLVNILQHEAPAAR